MTNRLPEKLTLLRKHFGYAQADIAAKLNVSVAEYMSWENGSMLCRIDQLRKLAALYSVPVADFIDNTREVRLPRADEIYDSVQIPFQNLNRPASENTLEEDIADNILPIASIQPQPAGPDYAVYTDPAQEDLMVGQPADDISHTLEFDATGLQEVQNEPEPAKEEVYEEEEYEEEPSGFRPDRRLFILAASILVLLFVVLSGMRACSGADNDGGDDDITVRISDTNRLALGRTFSAFVNDDGTLTSMGNLNTGSYRDLVQISAANSWMAGLQKDGKVVLIGSSNYNEAKKWTGIVNIAAADTHIAGVKDDGSVICTGSDTACAVENWKDIQSVYAGNGFTIGKKRRGGLVVSGNISSVSELESLSDVSSVSVGDNHVVVTDSSGRVTCYPTGSAAAPNTAAWSGIKSAVSGSGFAAGLTPEGKIVTAASDDAFSRQAASLSNVLYIAARGGTLVAADVNGNIIGAGDNTNKVYGDAPAGNTDDPDDSEKLAKVSNVKFEIKADNVSITWDAVQGASYYMVKVNTYPETSLRSVRNSASIPAKSFEDGKTYRVTITASGSTSKKDSDPAVMEYQYSAVVTKLDAPKNLKAEVKKDTWDITWDSVKKAKKYIVTIDSDPEIKLEVTGTKAAAPVKNLKDGTSYTIRVVASDGNEKNNSDPLTGTFEYHPAVKQLDAPSNIKVETVGDSWKITWDAVEHAGSYKVNIGSASQSLLVGTNEATYGTGSLTDGNEYEIRVTSLAADGDESYRDSKESVIKVKYTAAEYTVILRYTGVWSGSRSIQLGGGTYTLQQLFDLTGDRLESGQYLANPDNTAGVPMAGDNIVINIVTDELVCTSEGNVWQDGACKTPQQIEEEEAARRAEEERQKNISDCQNNGGTWSDEAGCVYPEPDTDSETDGSSEG